MSNRQGLTDAQVLCALYNASHAQGMGMFQARPGDLTEEEARRRLGDDGPLEPGQRRAGAYVDYLNGRVIKTDVSDDPLDFRLYDRDMGQGAGDRAIFAYLDKLTRPEAR